MNTPLNTLWKLAQEISRSQLFDADFYRRQAGLPPIGRRLLAYHYVTYGEKRGFAPSPSYDPAYYSTTYPDLANWTLPLLVHYLRHGHQEGRSGVPTTSPSSHNKSIKRTIIDSGEFDQKYYEAQTSTKFSSLEEAVIHYLHEGEDKDFKPTRAFDPRVYRSYADLKNYRALFYHFLVHGRSEGRIGFYNFSNTIKDGNRAYLSHRKTIVLAVHEASLTGAPILGVNLLQRLAEEFNVVFCSMRGGGPILSYASEFAVALIVGDRDFAVLNPDLVCDNVLEPIKKRFNVSSVIANSVETHSFVVAASKADLPVLSLIHEFATYTSPFKLENMITYSQKVVFSSSLTQASAKAIASGDFRNSAVFPQGQSKIPDVQNLTDSDKPRTKVQLEDFVDQEDFLCIGCGYVQYRKGVDLFIAAAASLKRQHPERKMSFVWIGDGYEPDRDLAYSVWLRDQIERSGLTDTLRVVSAMDGDSLNEAYRRANALFLSSRLDPFPNVAIDAIAAGLPVVTFDQANGVAEYLKSDMTLAKLVAPYLDVEAAASILLKLMGDKRFANQVAKKFRTMAAVHFDMGEYCKKLKAILSEIEEIKLQEVRDVKTITSLGPLDLDMLGLDGNIPPDEAAKYYVRRCASQMNKSMNGIERRPVAGFSPGHYAYLNADLDTTPFPNVYAHWLSAGSPSGPWTHSTIELTAAANQSFRPPDLSIALHLHLHFSDQAGEFRRRLLKTKVRPALLISVTDQESAFEVGEVFADYDGDVVIRVVPNRGRDIGPFLTAFNDCVPNYDIIGHMHGKRSTGMAAGSVDDWRTYLYETLLGGKYAALDQIIEQFERNSLLGLVYPENPQSVGWTDNLSFALGLLHRLRLKTVPPVVEFPVGNMFFARTTALAALFDANFELDEFPAEPLPYDGTELHAIERLTPLVVQSAGYEVLSVYGKGLSR